MTPLVVDGHVLAGLHNLERPSQIRQPRNAGEETFRQRVGVLGRIERLGALVVLLTLFDRPGSIRNLAVRWVDHEASPCRDTRLGSMVLQVVLREIPGTPHSL